MASRGVNSITLIGRLGADPEMRYTPQGTAVANARLAVNRRPRTDEQGESQQETDWFSLVFWQKLAETAAEYLHKGDRVYVSGRMQSRQWQGRQAEEDEPSGPSPDDIPF